MPPYTMQDALEAEQRVKDAEAYNRAAARNSNAARLALAEAKRSLASERGPSAIPDSSSWSRPAALLEKLHTASARASSRQLGGGAGDDNPRPNPGSLSN